MDFHSSWMDFSGPRGSSQHPACVWTVWTQRQVVTVERQTETSTAVYGVIESAAASRAPQTSQLHIYQFTISGRLMLLFPSKAHRRPVDSGGRRSGRMVHGAWCMVHGACSWFMVHGS